MNNDQNKQPANKWSTKKKLLVGLGVTALAVGVAAAVIFTGGAAGAPALAAASEAITTFATATAAPWISAAATNLWAGTTGLAATLGVVGTTAQAAAAGVAIGAAVIGGGAVLKTIGSGISSMLTSDRDRLHKHLVKAEKYAERTPGAAGIGKAIHKSTVQLEQQPSSTFQNRVTQPQGRSAFAR